MSLYRDPPATAVQQRAAPKIDLGLPPPQKVKLDLPPPKKVNVELKPTKTRRDRLG